MRKHVSHLAVALLTAALGVACADRNDTTNDSSQPAQRGGERGVNARITLAGCVNAAPGGGDKFVLRNVSEPAPPEQPSGQGGVEREPFVPRGSWVRLTTGNDDLKPYLGKHVTVEGSIKDTGENTIGTSGHASEIPRAGEADSHAPEIAVERVTESEGTCTPVPGDGAHTGGDGRGGR